MSLLEQSIAAISPGWAARRARNRAVLAYYDAVRNSRLRRDRTKEGTGDQIVGPSAARLRAQARYLERNYDIARGALNRLVQQVVGAHGIGVEPQPRSRSGELLEDFADDIVRLLRDWENRPEVTWQHDWASCQRMLCRAWIRDGDGLAQRLRGAITGLDHGTEVPYSIELLEADDLPLDFYDAARGVVQGVQRNAWGRPSGYWFYRVDLTRIYGLTTIADLKFLPAEDVLHIKSADRIRQARGVSAFASVLTRLDDIKDYEESERIAAKVAASMAAYIKKGSPDEYDPASALDESGHAVPRHMRFRPGMVFDDLRPGEEIGTIDTKRPNPNTESFRNGQLRAASAGFDVSASSFTRNYDGTYSAQRQELVEQWRAYEVLSDEFGERIVLPVYRDLIGVAIAAGKLRVPRDIDPLTIDAAIMMPPQMPWIDPLKEVLAWRELEEAGYASGTEIIRRRGLNPRDVIDQEVAYRRMRESKGLDPVPADRRDPAEMRAISGHHE